ncbi:MAG: hypothetical protein RL638_1681 [Bacteroidota bacterium]|jgi:hypothetical protein
MTKQLRLFWVIIGLSVFTTPIHAQFLMPVRKVTGNFFRLGIKGGVSMANIKTDGLTVNGIGGFVVDNINSKSGYTAGAYMRLGRKVFVEPELLFSYKNASFDILRTITSQQLQFDVRYTSLDVPVMLGYRLGPIHFLAGPVFSYSMNSNSSIAEAIGLNLGSLQAATQKAYISYTAGVGIDLLGLTIDLRYEGNVTDISKTVPLPAGVNFSQKAALWQATLGLKIL